jgi:hypothetical protein
MTITNALRRRAYRACALFLLFALQTAAGSEDAATPVAPAEHRRGTEQTFLTFPEWFLVFSPAEYAAYVKDRAPTEFPFIGHIRQFWESYGAVYRSSNDGYPFNFGYHVMIIVIGTSTTIEYAIKSVYETLIGRLSGLTATRGLTEEDRFGAWVAQDYVDFIRVLPWYEYDFKGKLVGLWRETGWRGPDAIRRWERKYALTSEYGIKAVYGWLIKKATKASYDAPLMVTAVVVDRLPADLGKDFPDLKVLQRFQDRSALVTVPRYDAFTRYASELARRGSNFREIAGNRSIILLSVLAPRTWEASVAGTRVLFTQPVLTQPELKRVALVVPIASLASQLNALRSSGVRLEHVFDY